MAGAHAVAAIIKQAPGQKGGRAAQPAAPRHGLDRKLGLHGFEQRPIQDRRVVAAMDLAPVDHLADVEPVLEQVGERPHPKGAAADKAAIGELSRLAADAPADRDPRPGP